MITEEEVVKELEALENQGQLDELLAQTDFYLKDNPNLAALYRYKGNAFVAMERWQDALAAYRQAIANDPNDIHARTNYALALFNLNDYVGALNAADAAVLMGPDFADPYLITGNILSLLGFPEQAMYAYHQAFTFRPNDMMLGAYVAELYAEQEEPQEAFNLLMELLDKNPHNSALQLQMATTLCFFLKNGVPLKQVDDFVKQWRQGFSREQVVVEAGTSLAQHDVNYTPLSLEHLQQAFDTLAPVYDRSAADNAQIFTDFLNNELARNYAERDNLTVLDIGCGTGLGVEAIVPYAAQGQLYGVDIASKLLDIANEKGIYNKLFHSEATFLIGQQSQGFDVLIASDSLPFFSDLNTAFASFNRALKTDGHFYFSIRHNTLSLDDKLLYPPYNYIFESAYIQNCLQKNGFEIVSVQSMQDGSDEFILNKNYFYNVRKVQ